MKFVLFFVCYFIILILAFFCWAMHVRISGIGLHWFFCYCTGKGERIARHMFDGSIIYSFRVVDLHCHSIGIILWIIVILLLLEYTNYISSISIQYSYKSSFLHNARVHWIPCFLLFQCWFSPILQITRCKHSVKRDAHKMNTCCYCEDRRPTALIFFLFIFKQ